jgi:SHS2 domain-containing protein
MPERHWSHFHHESDIGVRGYGSSREEAFQQAALALTAVITEPSTVEPKTGVEIRCEAPEDALLFVDWLNALIYEMATRKMLFSRFEVHLKGTRLEGTAWGERTDVERHQPAVEVKGATYTELDVRQDADGLWLAQCVVDV